MKTIAYRFLNSKILIFYVSDLIGKVGDWGYTTDPKKAIDLSPYWQRRFNADCNTVGVTAKFLTIEDT